MDLRKVTIETERLLLVPISRKYSEQVLAEYREPVTKYMNHGPPDSIEDVDGQMEQREIDMKNGTMLFMIALEKQSDEFLGCFVLEDLDQKNPEMGGWIKKSAHGNGFGREAAAGLKQWADSNLEYDYILWPCAVMNISSRKVAESLGGTASKEYEKKTASGKIWPYVEYRIPKK